MKIFSFRFILACALPVVFVGCAGDKADLEEAAYLLGKGGTANATAALNLVSGYTTSGDADIKLEAIRLYAGAKMAIAGFDSIKITSNLIYRESDDTISIIKAAVTLDSDAQTLLENAESTLSTLITSDAAFTGASTAKKADIHFLLGLVRLFKAARTALVAGGISTSTVATYDQTACLASVNANISQISTLNTDLSGSESSFNDSGLTDGNSIVKLVTNFEDQVPQTPTPTEQEKADLCTYLVAQNGL
jgi:hypothetical protein